MPTALDEYLNYSPSKPSSGDGALDEYLDYAAEFAKSIPRGAATTSIAAAAGAAELATQPWTERMLQGGAAALGGSRIGQLMGFGLPQAGQVIEDIEKKIKLDPDVSEYINAAMTEGIGAVQRAIPVTPGFEDSWTRKIGEGVGSLPPAVAAFAAGGPAGLAAFSGSAAQGSLYNELRERDVPPEQAQAFSFLSAVTSAGTANIGAVPQAFRIFERLDDAAGHWLTKIGLETGKGVVREGAQETIEEVPSEIARQVYDKERTLIDSLVNLAQTGAVGGIVGGFLGTFASAVKVVRDRGRDAIVADYQQRVEAGQADATPSQQVFEQNGFDGGTRKERAAEVQTFIEEQQNAQGPIPDVRVVEGQVRQDAGGQDYQRGGEAGATQEGGQVAEEVAKQPWEMTATDLVSKSFKFPKNAYRGELLDANDNYVGHVWLHEGRGYVATPKSGSRVIGEVDKQLPVSFPKDSFEKAGGLRLSAGQSVQYWKLKKPVPGGKPESTSEPEQKFAAKAISTVQESMPRWAPGERLPWQMPRDDYVEYQWQLTKSSVDPSRTPNEQAHRASYTDWHRQLISQAVAAGKPVPPEVLSDYPDLARQVPPQGEVAPEISAPPEGGIPAETQAAPEISPPKTGLRNEITDAERAARNAPPIARAEAVRNPVLWAEAERVLRANPNAGYELVEGFEANPRTLSDLDAFVLLRHKVDVRARHADALNRIVQAQEANDPAAEAAAKADEQLRAEQLTKIDEVNVASGTQWGRAGQVRQMEAAEDYSLSRMVMKKRADLGRALKPEELAHVKELSDKNAELERQLAVAEAKAAENRVDDFILKNEPQKPKAGSRRKADARKALGEAWREFAALGGGTLFSNPVDLGVAGVKLAKAGIDYGIATFQEFWAELGKVADAEVLAKARPILEKAWQRAITENKPTAAGRKLESPASMTRFAKELGRYFLQTGVKGRDAVIDAVHAELLKVVPGMTRRQAAEAIVGYGQTTPLSKDAIEAELRSIVGEERELLKQEDIARKIVPPRSGPQFQKPGGEERRLKKLTSEAMKRAGLTTTDPETQLQSALQSIETRLRNQIADVQAQIDKGERLIKERKEPPTNERIEALREQLEVLNERLDAIAPRPGRTAEQRLDSYKKRLMARNAELTDKLARKDYSKATRKPPPTDPEVEELLAQRDDLHREVAKMRAKDQFASLSPIRKVASVTGDLLNNVQKAIVLGLDASFLGLQLGVYHLSHPVRAIQNDVRALQAMSQKRADALIRRRRHSPNASLHRRGKVVFTDPHGPPNANEEMFRSSLIDRIPGLSHLSRFASEAMNGAREDWFDGIAWGLSRNGKNLADHEAKAIGSGVNIFTGRGNFGDYQGAAKILYIAFLAPKYVLSRFQIVLGQPMWRGSARTRIAFAKEYARLGVGMASLYGLIYAGLYAAYGPPGDDKEWDINLEPTDIENRSWGQVRIGDQLYEYSAGLRAPFNLIARQAGGLYRAAAGKRPKYDPDPLGGFGYFIRSKLNVYPRAYVDFKKGETISGEKATPMVVLRDLFSPITAKEVVQKMDSHGIPRAFIDGFLQASGWGVSDAHRATKRKGRYPREIVSQP